MTLLECCLARAAARIAAAVLRGDPMTYRETIWANMALRAVIAMADHEDGGIAMASIRAAAERLGICPGQAGCPAALPPAADPFGRRPIRAAAALPEAD